MRGHDDRHFRFDSSRHPAQSEPVLLGPEIYVTAALLGSASYIGLQSLSFTAALAMPLAMALAFALRTAILGSACR